jgi:chemotaxis protein methyltransferase WspC
MTLAEVESEFRTRTGLDPAALGASAFPLAVGARMRECRAPTPAAYLALLKADPDEATALAAELVVPETWFFRGGRELFVALARFVASRANPDRADAVRVLSIPCSTGEEPYSLAIALHDLGVPPERYELHAADLSPRHLAIAASGLFPANAFREPGADSRPGWFAVCGDRWEILPPVRGSVRFRRGNPIEPGTFECGQTFDLILCRNLFIYLTPEARGLALASLDQRLAPDGRLCLTPAEAHRLPPNRFVADGRPEFGIYRRAEESRGVADPRGAPTLRPARRAHQPAAAARTTVEPRSKKERPASEPITHPRPLQLQQIRDLADAGLLAEARAACERLVQAEPQTPAAHALLGVIQMATGNTDAAAAAFRSALYLEPNHAEALSHMILVCDRRGDAAQAASLRRRLACAEQEGTA